jgi:hypothetical protein
MAPTPSKTSPLEDSPTSKEDNNRGGFPSLGGAPMPLIFTPTDLPTSLNFHSQYFQQLCIKIIALVY